MTKKSTPQKKISIGALYIIGPVVQGVATLFCFQFEHMNAGILCALVSLVSVAIGAAKVSVVWR